MQPALHRFAYAHVLFLDTMANGDALLIVFLRARTSIRKIKVENHAATVDGKGQHEIRIEITFIPVQHKVGILPKIERALALPRRRRISIRIRARRFHGARLKAETIFVLDRVIRIVKHAVQSLVEIRNVVPAIEKIIDVNFPVAVQIVAAALKKMKRCKTQWLDALDSAA